MSIRGTHTWLLTLKFTPAREREHNSHTFDHIASSFLTRLHKSGGGDLSALRRTLKNVQKIISAIRSDLSHNSTEKRRASLVVACVFASLSSENQPTNMQSKTILLCLAIFVAAIAAVNSGMFDIACVMCVRVRVCKQ